MNQKYLKTLVRYENGFLYWKVRRSNCIRIGSRVGTAPKTGYAMTSIDNKVYKTHRLIFLYHNGWLPYEVDHANGISTDNRIENLRAATASQNQYNASMRPDNTSGVRGVVWYPQTKRWRAAIRVEKKRIHIGYFKDLKQAEIAVLAARNKHHKEFAKL